MLTQAQTWLLQAMLSKREKALESWQQWRDHVDIEMIDLNSYRMLSALYLKLSNYKADDLHMGRLKGIYRHTWYTNQLQLQRLAAGLQALQSAQIEAVVLGEVSLLAACHHDWGARPITRFDLLVPQQSMPMALSALQQQGWQSSVSVLEPSLSGPLWVRDTVQSNSVSLCLHNHVFWATPQTHTDEQLWQHATTTEISNTSAKILSPVDQLLYLSLKMNQQQYDQQQDSADALVNAAFAVTAITEESEWVRLLVQAQRYELILPLRYLLTELQQLLEIELPDWVMPNLRGMAISYHELLSHNISADNRLLLLKAQIVKLRAQWHKLTRKDAKPAIDFSSQQRKVAGEH
ncbi:MAG: nucleotidyltransferase family protein [Cyanobacteria bacterium P01_D01_bin.105]